MLKTRSRLFTLLFLLVASIPIGLTLRNVRQARLDHALRTAIAHNDTEAVLGVLEQGADPNIRVPAYRNSSWWQLLAERLQGWRRDEDSRDTMLRAALKIDSGQIDSIPGVRDEKAFADNPRIVQALLNHGALLTADRFAPPLLCIAAQNGETNTVRLLIKHGAEPNVRDRSSGGGTKDFTPLLYAAMRGRQETVRCLLDLGVDVNLRSSHGDTALQYAVEQNALPTLKAELNSGGSINEQNSAGNTPLMQAAESGNAEIVRFLLNHHADSQIRNYVGKTALELAQARKTFFARTFVTNSHDAHVRNQRNQLNAVIHLLSANSKP